MNSMDAVPQNLSAAGKKQLAARMARSGQTTEALRICRELCEQLPEDPEAWHILGAMHGSLDDYASAEACSRKALSLAPNHPAILFNLAIALARQGKQQAAGETFRRCLQANPGHADACHELGNLQAAEGSFLAAIASYRKAIQLRPDAGLYHFNLGCSHLGLKQLDEAAACYRRSIELNPRFRDAYLELASIHRYRDEHLEEIDTLRKAREQCGEDAELLYRLGSAYRNKGESGLAQQHFEKTLLLEPGHAGALTGVAEHLGLQGKYDAARSMLEKILATHPENIPTVVTYAQYAVGTAQAGKAIDLILQALEKPDLTGPRASTLYSSLGALYESRKEYDLAFKSYRKGNRLKGEKFDYPQVQRTFYAIMSTFSAGNLRSLPHSGNPSSKPVFIVGMPRSGSSLTEQILASHPDVYGAGELTTIGDLAAGLPARIGSGQHYFLSLEGLTGTVLDQLAQDYLADISGRSGGERLVTDKMPSNFMHLGLIELMFPNARVIHCTRDPLDTCLSCYFKNFRGTHPYAYDLGDLGRFYLLYQRLMAHWKQALNLPVCEISYEKLVMDLPGETRRLLEFCDLEWNEACLQFHRTDRTVATASHAQVRNPIYTKSIGKWRHYKHHLGPLFAALNMPDLQ